MSRASVACRLRSHGRWVTKADEGWPNVNLKFLETFVWVASLRSFSVAADKLCTTQASVSNRIATLERDLGVRLFERDLRNVSLTPHGQRALAQAEAIVRMVKDFQRTIASAMLQRSVAGGLSATRLPSGMTTASSRTASVTAHSPGPSRV